MSQKRTFLSKCPLMTHCSVHTMSLQLEPVNTVFMPAGHTNERPASERPASEHGRGRPAPAGARRPARPVTYRLCCGGPTVSGFGRSFPRRCERCPTGSGPTEPSRCVRSACAAESGGMCRSSIGLSRQFCECLRHPIDKNGIDVHRRLKNPREDASAFTEGGGIWKTELASRGRNHGEYTSSEPEGAVDRFAIPSRFM